MLVRLTSYFFLCIRKNILQASKITEATQFIISYAKITEQIYFRSAVLYYSVILVIALVIIRRTHKAHRTDRGAENPTEPKLPDFTLFAAAFYFILSSEIMENISAIKVVSIYSEMIWYHFNVD